MAKKLEEHCCMAKGFDSLSTGLADWKLCCMGDNRRREALSHERDRAIKYGPAKATVSV